MEAYIRRAIQNDDPADCSARICLFKQLDLLMSGYAVTQSSPARVYSYAFVLIQETISQIA